MAPTTKKGTKEAPVRRSRSKKRKCPRPKPEDTNPEHQDTEEPSASRRKLRDSNEFKPTVRKPFGYYILEFFTVFHVLSDIVRCKVCGNEMSFAPVQERGLGFKIKAKCKGVCATTFINSGPFINNGYEINKRVVLAMRLIGVGYAGLRLFCGIMDLPTVVNKNYYLDICKSLLGIIKRTAERCMNKAASEEKEESIRSGKFEDQNHVAVSNDGSWMKRGFTSLFGIIVIIGTITGKVLDINIKSAYCKVCEIWEKMSETAEYEDYVNEHWVECTANHEGSSGKMEVSGTVEMFERSMEKRGLIYKMFIGDGDSKTHKAVVEAKPYGDCDVEKKECVGHVGKRMGSRLRNAKTKNKGLGGKGKLTGTQIDKLSQYYGKAIRENPQDSEKMSEAIWATYYHRASTDTKPQHHLCPKGEDSWCGWQRAKAKKELKKYKHENGLPQDVMTAIKPIYEDLTKKELLDRCTGAFTQNSNESFNSTVWAMAPKIKFSGLIHVEMASYLAVCFFNEGHKTIMTIMNEAGMPVGERCAAACDERDADRLRRADQAAAASTKQARIALRQARLDAQDAATFEEGQLYGPGEF